MTPALKVLNTALCPRCHSPKTARGGYVREKQGSAWKCRACAHEFTVRTLVFASPSA